MGNSCQFVALSVMPMHRIPLYLLCAAELVRTAAGAPFAGQYLAYGSKLYPCATNESKNNIILRSVVSSFNIKEPSALQRLYGNITYYISFDDTFWARTRIDSRSSDGQRWLKNAFLITFPGKACSMMREHVPGLARILLGGDEIMKRKSCSVQTGEYSIGNQAVNWTVPHFPIMPYGHMRIQQLAGRGQDTDYCHMFEFNVIPRPKLGNNG
ncbi:uncharacterized protein LOC113205218 [Frankliniella occidentalis]|uniref:Uncharacterized protein LOC113205218 n=1 Tax=Frankliniella occidentalis TaxID=133901 RepID=A0A6J1S778_FRAOC|nr:uncharacterized protein LOC113205218 [Frankliniella occidentalis]